MARRRFSDAQLLTIELIVADPYVGDNLRLEKLSSDVSIVEAINIHDYHRYPADRVHCCVCGARRHKK